MMEKIWGAFSYIAAVFIAALFVDWKSPKRKYFYLRLIVGFMVLFFFLYTYDQLISLIENGMIFFILHVLDCFVVFFGVLIVMRIAFNRSFWADLFCVTAGYCMQHTTKIVNDFIGGVFDIQSWWISAILLTLVTVICYWIIFFIVLRKRKYENISVDNALQTIVSAIVLTFSIVIYLISIRFVMKTEMAKPLLMLIQSFSFIIAMLTFFIEFGLLSNRRLIEEKNSMMNLLEKERKQYQLDQEKINIINIKCHDIAAHIAYLKEMPATEDREQYINELQKNISIFGKLVNTGNAVLDMLLSEKSLICEQDKIQLSCIIDGAKLDFMDGLDIYSLFGNAVNNAIEYLKNLEEEEKRLLSVKVFVKNQFLCINFENYFEADLEFENDLPKTTKSDQNYHGFGMKSIKYIVDKYNGKMVVDASGHLFSLGISIPLNNDENIFE